MADRQTVIAVVVWFCTYSQLLQVSAGLTIGIDVGSSHVRVAVVTDGAAKILRNDLGRKLTPSCVAFVPTTGRRLIGDEAKSQLVGNPHNTVCSVLPLLGRRFDDAEVQHHIKQVPYTVRNRNSTPSIELKTGESNSSLESFQPEELVAMLLSKMKQIAETHLNDTVASAVVSVPSCFGYSQRMAMRDAGAIAGFNNTHIVNAPEAAAVAYGMEAGATTGTRVLVADAGGSCLGLAVVSITSGSIETEAHGSTCEFGGEIFQQRVMEHMVKLLENAKGEELVEKFRKDEQWVERIRREAERAVRFLLTSSDRTLLEVEYPNGDEYFSTTLTPTQFNEMNKDLFKIPSSLVKKVLQDAALSPEDIQEYVLTGGLSFTPWLRNLLSDSFGGEDPYASPDEAEGLSAMGAAWWAALLDGEKPRDQPAVAVLTLCSHTIGFGGTSSSDFVKMLNDHDPLPATNSRNGAVPGSKQKAISSATLNICEVRSAMTNWTIGPVTAVAMEFPPTTSPDVWIAFTMKQFDILEVTIDEMKTGTDKAVVLDHGLARSEMEQMRQRAQTLDRRDHRHKKRSTARDDLEQLAYWVRARLSKGRLEAPSASGAASCSELKLLDRTALDAIEWLDSSEGVDMYEFVRRRRELELLKQKVEL